MGVSEKVVLEVLRTQQNLVEEALVMNGKVVVPGLVMIKLRQMKATPPMTKNMFGKIVQVKAKPAKKIVKAFPAKQLKLWMASGIPGIWK